MPFEVRTATMARVGRWRAKVRDLAPGLVVMLLACGGVASTEPSGDASVAEAAADGGAAQDANGTSLFDSPAFVDASPPPPPSEPDGGPPLHTPCGGDGPATCTGCCNEDGVCVIAETNAACGTAAGACVACAAGESCDGGACVRPQPSCGPSNCAGCCIGDSACADGTQNAACGQFGAACAPCTRCRAAAGGGGTCGNPTCAGCSLGGNNCTIGMSQGACGMPGEPCHACTNGQQCAPASPSGSPSGGVCQDAGACGPQNCPGCCDGTTCLYGNQDVACGTGGSGCFDCTVYAGSCQSGACQ